MLLKYSFENFKSFEEEYTFSMFPGRKMDRFEDNVITTKNGIRCLKSAVVVGENGGGKSNFIESLSYLKSLFTNTEPIRAYRGLLNYNKMDIESVQKFCIQAYVKNIMYYYELQIDGRSIKKEQLEVSSNANKKIKVFDWHTIKCEVTDRNKGFIDAKVYVNEKFAGIKKIEEYAKGRYDYNGLFINKLSILDVDIVKPFCKWINNSLIVKSPSMASLSTYLKIRNEEDDLRILKEESFLEIFQLVDASIKELVIDEEEPFKDTLIIRIGENERKYQTKISKESSGIQDFLAWSISIWKVIYENATVFADEMDKVLNPLLAERIISLIHGSEHMGQFIFSTHNILHLNTRNFMKQQLWIVTKNKEALSSEIYSLSAFKEFRYDRTDIYNLYLNGILGGTING